MNKRRGEHNCDYKVNSAAIRKHTIVEQKYF